MTRLAHAALFLATPEKVAKRRNNLCDTWTPKVTQSINHFAHCPSRPWGLLRQPKSTGSWQSVRKRGRAHLYATGPRVVPRFPTEAVSAPSRMLRRRAPARANPVTACPSSSITFTRERDWGRVGQPTLGNTTPDRNSNLPKVFFLLLLLLLLR